MGAGCAGAKGELAVNDGDAFGEEGERPGCERVGLWVVEGDFQDKLGDKAGESVGTVDVFLEEVEGEMGCWEGEGGGGDEEWVLGDCDMAREGR